MSHLRRTVDWRSVEAELERLPDEFQLQRFESIAHVVDILRALDPTQALVELQERQLRIERLVDDIVRRYHGGFNKSIHNYSEILRLFTEAQDQVKAIRDSLVESKQQLGSRSQNLKKQWLRSTSLTRAIEILGDIEHIAGLPSQLDALIERGSPRQLSRAVALVIEAEGKLRDDSDLLKVKALSELGLVLADKRKRIKRKILAAVGAYVCRGSMREVSAGASGGDSTLVGRWEEGEQEGQGVPPMTSRELVRCVCDLDSPEVVVSWLQDNYTRHLRQVVAHAVKAWGLETYSGAERGQSHLFPPRFMAQVRLRAEALCLSLLAVFDRHVEVVSDLIPHGIASSQAAEVLRVLWSTLEEEVVCFACSALGAPLPEGMGGDSIAAAPFGSTGQQDNASGGAAGREGGDVRTVAFSFGIPGPAPRVPSQGGRGDGGAVGSPSPAKALGAASGLTGYLRAARAGIGEEAVGPYVLVALYEPLKQLCSGLKTRVQRFVGEHVQASRRAAPGADCVSAFLEEYVLETFMQLVKQDCKARLARIAADTTSMERIRTPRDLRTSHRSGSGGAAEGEMSAFLGVVRQTLQCAERVRDYLPHFAAIVESLVVQFLDLPCAKCEEQLQGMLAARLACGEKVTWLMSRESLACLLSDDFFLGDERAASIVGKASDPPVDQGDLLSVIQGIRPLSSASFFSSTEDLRSVADALNRLEMLATPIEAFLDERDKASEESEDEETSVKDLAALLGKLKAKMGFLLRVLRLEMKLKCAAAFQDLEGFPLVFTFGCESLDASSLSSYTLTEECSSHVARFISSVLRYHEMLMALTSKNYLSYIASDLGEWTASLIKCSVDRGMPAGAAQKGLLVKDIVALKYCFFSSLEGGALRGLEVLDLLAEQLGGNPLVTL